LIGEEFNPEIEECQKTRKETLVETEKKLLGSRAIVTGAAQGIGEAVAKTLAREGASVALADINLQGAERVASEINDTGGTTLSFKVDVTQPAQVADMVRNLLEQWKTIDILVNNAGGFSKLFSILEVTEAEWDQIIALNLKSVFICIQAVVKEMMEKRKGRIINLASQVALGPNPYAPSYFPYGAAKTGVVGLTKHLAKELGPYGITVNAISPGVCLTPRLLKLRDAQTLKTMADTSALRHLVEPKDIAEAVLFLASEAGRFITGINLSVNSGGLIV
jgi:NAD(P)-dependent dehydrogenase (short-subunit alcohol dehydrogenase family)